MAEGKQNPLALGGLIVVIVICLMLLIKSLIPERYAIPEVDWYCEACEYGFQANPARSPIKCPECGELEAVRSVYYVCTNCGEEFEAYRRKSVEEIPDSVKKEMGVHADLMRPEMTKSPDGEWVYVGSAAWRELVSGLSCPKCGNTNRKTLKPAAQVAFEEE